MKKFELKNNGIPMFIDDAADLPAKKDTGFDSWYVISSFTFEGKQYGFEWHQQSISGQYITAEFLLMDGDRNIYSNNAYDGPIAENAGASEDLLDVYCPLGRLSGNREEMKLSLKTDDGSVDVVLKPRKAILCNGTTGLLQFLNGDSYEYAYPNMDIEGSMTLKGRTIPIQNTTAWFDRQWGFQKSNAISEGTGLNKMAWLWLGLPLKDGKESLSLWDSYCASGRNNFATILREDGVQYNVPATVTYENIWTSEKSGNSYPRTVTVSIPEAELSLKLSFISENPEFYREGIAINGCQSLCKVTGSYQGESIDCCNILELIGDVCGEI